MKMETKLNKKTLAIVTDAAKGNGKIFAGSLDNSGAPVVRVDLLELVQVENILWGKLQTKLLFKMLKPIV